MERFFDTPFVCPHCGKLTILKVDRRGPTKGGDVGPFFEEQLEKLRASQKRERKE